MKRMIVNAPTGVQEFVLIEESGGYFDPARVVWNEWVDGDLPQGAQLGGLVRTMNGGTPTITFDANLAASTQSVQFTQYRAGLAAQIENAVQSVYQMFTAAQLEEYKLREAEATAYQAAASADPPQPLPACLRVQGFATAQGIDLATAVSATLTQAAQLHGALAQLSDLRMAKRYVVRADVTDQQAQDKAAQAVAACRAIAKQLA